MLFLAGPAPSQATVDELFAPEDLPERQAQETIEEVFGARTPAFALLEGQDPREPATVRAQAAILEELEDPEPEQAIGLAPAIAERTGQPVDSLSDEELREAVQRASLDREPLNGLVADSATLLVLAFPADVDDRRLVDHLDSAIASVQADYPGTIEASGPAHVEVASQDAGTRDVQLLLPLALALTLVVLYLTFRRTADVAFAAGTALVATGWAYGSLPWLRVPLSPLLFSVAPLLVGLGIDYVLHVVYAYRDAGAADVAGGFEAAGSSVGRPVAFTALTTGLGFAGFLASPIPQIRYWGALIGAGVVAAFLLCFTLMPALYGLRDRREHSRQDDGSWLQGPLGVLAGAVTRRRRGLAVGLVGLTLLAGAGAALVSTDTDVGSSATETSAGRTLAAIEATFGGQSRATVLVEAPASEIREPLDELTRAIAEQPNVTSVDSPTLRARAAFQGELPDEETYRAFLANGSASDLADEGYTLVQVRYDDEGLGRLSQAVEDSPLDAKLTGPGPLQEASRGLLLENIVLSTGAALVLVALALAAIYRSPRWWLLAFAPLPIVAVWQFGAMGAWGLPLNPVTGVTTAMMLGVGVDYAIHVTDRFRKGRSAGGSARQSAWLAVAATGRPVLATTATTAAAFAVLALSANPQVAQFGRVAAFVVVAALAVSLTLVPILGRWLFDHEEGAQARALGPWTGTSLSCPGCGEKLQVAGAFPASLGRGQVRCTECGTRSWLPDASSWRGMGSGPPRTLAEVQMCPRCPGRWVAGSPAGGRPATERCPGCGRKRSGEETA